MQKVTDIFKEKNRTISFELFPPKTQEGFENLKKTIADLCKLKPDFISCTYGAGGGSREKTFDIVEHIQKTHHIISVAHLTCVCHTKKEIRNILDDIKMRNVNNILALRGDPPKDNPHWQPQENNFKYSCELCKFIRDHHNGYFSIGVAGFPEGHPLSDDKETDAKYLKLKVDSGADYVITQLFFNNQDYFDYVKRLRRLGVTARIIPGIIPITDYTSLLNFCKVCGATVTDEIRRIFEPIKNDKQAVMKAGVEFAIRQCQELLDKGAPGLHFYCLNKVSPTDIILSKLKK